MITYIQNVRVYADRKFVPGPVLIRDGKFEAVGPEAEKAFELLKDRENTTLLDGQDRRLVPGFIDIHTHGAAGVDVNAADEEGLRKIAAFKASQGTTGFLTSVLTDTREQTLWCIDKITRVMQEENEGAKVLGIHLEGPFLSMEYKGAMPDHLILPASEELFREYQEAAGGAVRYITIAPEVENASELIRAISHETAVAIGHSAADYETSMDAIYNGARAVTHTFNAMKLFHQHAPAIMGAALESDVYCEAICDGRHLVPSTVRMLLKCKGWDRVTAVTDSIMAAGLPDGNYKLGVNEVVVVDGDAKLPNGVRAGSTLTMNRALKNLMTFTGHPLEDVIPLLTENPAATIRMADRKGKIKPGMDADCVLLDEECTVVTTLVGGRIVFSR